MQHPRAMPRPGTWSHDFLDTPFSMLLISLNHSAQAFLEPGIKAKRACFEWCYRIRGVEPLSRSSHPLDSEACGILYSRKFWGSNLWLIYYYNPWKLKCAHTGMLAHPQKMLHSYTCIIIVPIPRNPWFPTMRYKFEAKSDVTNINHQNMHLP